jgi:hypothetical protein
VVVWLCAVHISDDFLGRRGGKEFAERLIAVWVAAGVVSGRRIAAVRTHVRQIQNAMRDRVLPGSYSWPKLREEAERRFAEGEDPNVVIIELRHNYKDGPAMVPSVRTMRRWFTDGRWRLSPSMRSNKRRRRARFSPPRRSPRHDRTYLMLRRAAFPWLLDPRQNDP